MVEHIPRGSPFTTETLVGAAVLAVAAGFFFYASSIAGGGSSFSGGYRVIAEFDSAEGVNIGTDVRLAGIKIGTVTAQSLNPENYQARIEMTLDPKLSLADDSSAKISSEGLLGGKFVSLEPGGAEGKLADGSVISFTQGAVDIWSLLSEAMFNKGKPGAAMPAPDVPLPDAPAVPESSN
jgi:phospholipid/cholesterol/gamma-HCH transport system substrate-binding protein